MDARSPAHRQLGEILDVVSEVCYAVDADWRFVFFNGGAEAFFKIGRDRVLGQRLWDVVRRGRTSPLGRLLDQVMSERAPQRITHVSPMRPDRVVTARIGPLSGGGIVVAIEDVTERTLARQRQTLLLNELNHRVKNTLATVQAMARQTFRNDGVSKSASDAFEGRLIALSAAHNVLTHRSWEPAPLDEIVKVTLRALCDRPERLDVAGPVIALKPNSAVALSLAVYELGTNALKYGALSVPQGQITIRWRQDAQTLRFVWREHGGPPVRPPSHRGFGSRLLERGLAQDLGGTVELCFKPAGLVCTVTAPLEAL